MWWIALAHAELPWDCPTVSTPAEASPYRGSDAGAPDALDTIEALALAYWDEDCAWEFTSEDDGYTEEVTSTCTTPGYTLTHMLRSYSDFYGSSQWTSLDLSVPEGESWTRITLETSEWAASDSGVMDGTDTTREATWEGEIAGFPADGFLRYSQSTTTRYTDTRRTFVEAPGCSLRTSLVDVGGEQIDESVSFEPGTTVAVHRLLSATTCGEFTAYALVDGAAWGAVLAEDWSDDPADLDRDGYTRTCDCDEADPTRNAFAVETADDGVDQDCDGADWVTGDTGVVVDTGDTDAGEWTDPFGEPTPDPEICGCEAGGASSWWMIGGCLALVRRRRR